jgi:hypothetical protein
MGVFLCAGACFPPLGGEGGPAGPGEGVVPIGAKRRMTRAVALRCAEIFAALPEGTTPSPAPAGAPYPGTSLR